MAHRAICVTTNPLLRRTLRRTLQAVGSTVEFADSAAALPDGDAPDLVVLDAESRKTCDPEGLSARWSTTKVVVLGESLEEDAVVRMLRNQPFNHVISDQVDPDELELVVTSVKALRGDIFGLEKYLAWGVLVQERHVTGYDEKRDALYELGDYAKDMGARRQTVARIESVADEMLMNAMYDAPALRYGVAPRIGNRAGPPLGSEPAILRYSCDGRWFAVSVRDNYGELKKEAILDNLARARAEHGSPRPEGEDGSGAGLGLYLVLSSVTRFIANISPGHMTEVIGLFDLKATGRDEASCARSLHIFMASPG